MLPGGGTRSTKWKGPHAKLHRTSRRSVRSAALLLLGPITAVANAEPNESGVSDQAAHLPVELAEALQHDLALTPDQFVSRSELAQKLAEFAAIARVQFPDSFAGGGSTTSVRA